MKFKNWAVYLRCHPENEALMENLIEIVKLSSPGEDPEEVFKKISECPSLVVISRSAIGDLIQAVFNLFQTGSSLLKGTMKFGVLVGFGDTVTPIHLDPSMAFRFSGTERKVPPFSNLIEMG